MLYENLLERTLDRPGVNKQSTIDQVLRLIRTPCMYAMHLDN